MKIAFLHNNEPTQQRTSADENEQRFRNILETCPSVVHIAKSDGREVIFANKRYAELVNAESGRVLGADPGGYYANQKDYADILHRLGQDRKSVV